MENQNNLNTSFISEDTVIKGDILTNDNIIVEGVVEGVISSQRNVELKSGSAGGVNASNINVANCIINGDLKSDDVLYIDGNSQIYGNIGANRVKVQGVVKGRMDIRDKVELFSTASVNGDITAANIAIEEGAELQGKLFIHK